MTRTEPEGATGWFETQVKESLALPCFVGRDPERDCPTAQVSGTHKRSGSTLCPDHPELCGRIGHTSA